MHPSPRRRNPDRNTPQPTLQTYWPNRPRNTALLQTYLSDRHHNTALPQTYRQKPLCLSPNCVQSESSEVPVLTSQPPASSYDVIPPTDGISIEAAREGKPRKHLSLIPPLGRRTNMLPLMRRSARLSIIPIFHCENRRRGMCRSPNNLRRTAMFELVREEGRRLRRIAGSLSWSVPLMCHARRQEHKM